MFENENENEFDSFDEESFDTPTDDDFELSDDEFNSLDTETPGAQDETEEEEWELPIVYNGEEERLSREDAIRYAQMGKNYDKIQARYEELQNDPRLSFVEELARDNGYDNVQEFVNRRLKKFRGLNKQNLALHLKESQFRYNYSSLYLYETLISLLNLNTKASA